MILSEQITTSEITNRLIICQLKLSQTMTCFRIKPLWNCWLVPTDGEGCWTYCETELQALEVLYKNIMSLVYFLN